MRGRLAAGAAAALVAFAAGAGAAPAMPPDLAVKTPMAKPGSAFAQNGSISRERLRRGLARALRSAHASSSAYVRDLDARRRPGLFARRAAVGRIPASNEKLVTTAAVVRRFGGEGRLATRVYKRGEITGAEDRVLDGDLILVGAGDPALGNRSFASAHGVPLTPLSALARGIARGGIKRVTGDVKADDHVFDRRRGVGATGWRPSVDLSPLSGLSYNSGFSSGHYAKNPELVAARALRHMLREHGVAVKGGVGRAALSRAALERDPLAEVLSPTIASLIAATNKPSNNFFAEMLLKRLAATRSNRGTTRRGARKAKALARKLGAAVHPVDGSGLGRANRLSARDVVRLLGGMDGTDDRLAYRQSLPVAGREGTVADRMRGTAAEGRCRTKTGTLHDVSALSGYCRTRSGLVAFSILMNSVFDFDAAHRAQDRMAALIARYGR